MALDTAWDVVLEIRRLEARRILLSADVKHWRRRGMLDNPGPRDKRVELAATEQEIIRHEADLQHTSVLSCDEKDQRIAVLENSERTAVERMNQAEEDAGAQRRKVKELEALLALSGTPIPDVETATTSEPGQYFGNRPVVKAYDPKDWPYKPEEGYDEDDT